ncbi:MAG: thermonuclease family protein [Pseudomonadota bacterium]
MSRLLEPGTDGRVRDGSSAGPLSVEGRARAVDGDSVFIGRREVRLVGIDAPEGPQICQRNGRPWRCGDASRDALLAMISRQPIRCSGQKEDRHGRLLGTCRLGDKNLNAAMVEQGHAVAYGRYRREERRARESQRGLWAKSVQFQTPRAWRDENLRR